METLKAVFGLSRHKFNVIFFYMLTYASKMLYSHKYPQYKEELQKLKKHFSVINSTILVDNCSVNLYHYFGFNLTGHFGNEWGSVVPHFSHSGLPQ